MRLWSLHPSHLDRAALVACWRESLLAQKVLDGGTKGYTRHPQLERFRATPEPLTSIGAYLLGLHDEARERGYRFDAARILRGGAEAREILTATPLTVTEGQLRLEWDHLGAKLAARAPLDRQRWEAWQGPPWTHPLFSTRPGGVEPWERATLPS